MIIATEPRAVKRQSGKSLPPKIDSNEGDDCAQYSGKGEVEKNGDSHVPDQSSFLTVQTDCCRCRDDIVDADHVPGSSSNSLQCND